MCLDLPDILSVNLYPLWYTNESPASMLDRTKKWMEEAAGVKKPLLITEFGYNAWLAPDDYDFK